MIKFKKFQILFCFLLSLSASAQDLSKYEKQWFIQSGDTLPYRILFPENYDSSKAYPLLLFLHGRGESGTDNEKQLLNGAKLFLSDSFRTNYPAIVVFPQCSDKSYWSNVEMIMEKTKNSKRSFYFIPDGDPSTPMRQVMMLMRNLQVRFHIEQKRIYVMGLSMGGMGTFEIVRRMPGFFAAAIPICGGSSTQTAKQLTKTKWWIFHGAKDDVVLPSFSINMVSALKAAHASVKFTLYPNANHNSWDAAFAEPGIMQWLFSQHK